jgi:hypothetical protein
MAIASDLFVVVMTGKTRAMATNAKHLQEKALLKRVEKNADSSNSAPRRVALTPARRREIRRELIVEWQETLDILERHDRDGRSTDNDSK